jgi:hypothetical protein
MHTYCACLLLSSETGLTLGTEGFGFGFEHHKINNFLDDVTNPNPGVLTREKEVFPTSKGFEQIAPSA